MSASVYTGEHPTVSYDDLLSASDSASVQDLSHEEVVLSVDMKNTQEQHDNYLRVYRCWSSKKGGWMPFDPSTMPPPIAELKQDSRNYFHEEVRYARPGFNPATWSPGVFNITREDHDIGSWVPSIVLNRWSEVLLAFLRKTVGDNFFAQTPECAAEKLFPFITAMQRKLEDAHQLIATSEAKTDSECKDFVKEIAGTVKIDTEMSKIAMISYIETMIPQVVALLEYLNKEFQPIAEKLALVKHYGHVEYGLLEYFFDVGQEVVFEARANDSLKMQQIAYIISRVHKNTRENQVVITGYNYMWTGVSYERFTSSQAIPLFEGTREASELPVLHLSPERKIELKQRGRLYTELSGIHHRVYENQRVVVDELQYCSPLPMVGPYMGAPPTPMGMGRMPPPPPPPHWGAPQQPGYDGNDGYDYSWTYITESLESVPDDKMHLLPADVHAFNLSTKMWITCPVEKLEQVKFDDNAWEHLVLDWKTKKLIKGLVTVTTKRNMSDKIISDVIAAKGGGLLAVLHGPPGTGKTLTAEAIAEHLKRPIYIVGNAELPTNAAGLEQNLRNILTLSTRWDAIVLIDEADVFLEKRSLHEIDRNALVSVALRVLEYHRGVIFLTSNRVTSFDEAFLSRFSIAIHYPELDQPGRYAIWSKFFELARCRIVSKYDAVSKDESTIMKSDVERMADKPLNGRTIKNIVRTAQALALAEEEPFGIEQVEIVLSAQEKFITEFA